MELKWWQVVPIVLVVAFVLWQAWRRWRERSPRRPTQEGPKTGPGLRSKRELSAAVRGNHIPSTAGGREGSKEDEKDKALDFTKQPPPEGG